MLKWLPLFSLFLLIPVEADEIVIPGSESPNHKYVVYAVDNPESLQPSLELRETSSNSRIIFLGVSGYCDNAQGLAMPESTCVLWNVKGNYLAVKNRGTKTSTEITLYKQFHGTFSNVALPNFWDAIKSFMGLQHGGRCYFESPKEWKTDHILILNVSGSTIDSSDINSSDPEWYSYDKSVNTSGKILHIEEIKKGWLPKKGTE